MNNKRYIGILLVAVLMAVVVLPQIVMAQDTTPTSQCADVGFEGLAAGTVITNQIPGVSITTNDPIRHPAMIFNSANPTGGDLDLGTPNVDFGGPGRGAGGRSGADGENSVALGNVLIISEDRDSSDPDDNASGGQIIMTFDSPVTVASMVILDIDEPNYARIKLYDASGVELHSTTAGPVVTGGGAGDNGVYPVDLGVAGVSKIVVTLPGSGAVASVVFCEEVEVTPEPTTPAPTTPPATFTPPPTQITPTPPPEAECAIDLYVVLDESGGLDATEFGAETTFTLNLIGSLPVSPGGVNMGVGYFATFGGVTVPMTGSVSQLTDGVTANTQLGGFSNIAAGIDTAQAHLNSNGRAGVQDVILIISDGFQNSLAPADPVASANAARATGSLLYTIGVPDDLLGINDTVLIDVANGAANYFPITFATLDDISFVSTIVDSICPEPEDFPPVAIDDFYETAQNTVLVVPAPGVLSNDFDWYGDPVSVSSAPVSTVEGGTITNLLADGSFTYTPPAGFAGLDSFTYQITDGVFTSNFANVYITVTGTQVTPTTPAPSETTPAPSETTPAPSQTPEVTPPPATCEILRLELWNSETDQIIMILANGDIVDVAAFRNKRVTIVAVTNPSSVGSVELTLVGAENHNGVENFVPYALFGDNNGDLGGDHLNRGAYTITAKAYTQAYLRGILCAQVSLNFTVTNSRHTPPPTQPTVAPTEPTVAPTEPTVAPTEPTVAPTEPTVAPTEPTSPAPTCNLVHFKIWDARHGFRTYLENGMVFDLAVIGDVNAAFLIWTEPSPVGSVNIDVSGAITSNRTENVVPYTSFGNNGWNGITERTLVVGNYTITAIAYTEANGGGQICGQRTVSFTLIDSRQAPAPTEVTPAPTEATPVPTENTPPPEESTPPGEEPSAEPSEAPAEPSEAPEGE